MFPMFERVMVGAFTCTERVCVVTGMSVPDCNVAVMLVVPLPRASNAIPPAATDVGDLDWFGRIWTSMASKRKGKAAYMISAVAETYGIHPQTLRLYEREGLLKPSRSDGNTRLYTADDLEQLELILSLTRDLGVNLAGVEVVLNMRRRMEEMQLEMTEFIKYVEQQIANRSPELNQKIQHALVRVQPAHVVPIKTDEVS